MATFTWTNWGKNQSFSAAQFATPETEEQAVETIRQGLQAGNRVRVAGSGHSFTPVVQTDSLLLDLSRLSGVLSVDQPRQQAVVAGGSSLASLGEPLWQHGLSIENQGDVDAQSIAGAVATGTKGSGIAYGSLSSRVTQLRVINGLGEVVDIDSSNESLLHAAQVSLGMLGPVLRIGFQLVPAYRLKEENVILPMSEVLRQWDYFLTHYRHFSFWWMPTARSAAMYRLGEVPADHCFVKLLREVPVGEYDRPEGEANQRTDRAYRIYPDGTTDAEFHELEYMVDAQDAREAVARMQHLMLKQFPDEISPLQVRWQKADSGYLSPQCGRNSTSLSVSGEIGRDYTPFLRAVDRTLQPLAARPHWGKLHFLDRQRAADLYPDYARFLEIRRQFDPDNRFLNPHLAALFS
ncbi:D-arabinono-1,4-lactone oxidase [Pseudomonas graminis]